MISRLLHRFTGGTAIRLAVLALLGGMTVLLMNGNAISAADGRILVSNATASYAGASSLAVWDQSQAFTTGSNTSGYKLTGVKILVVVNNESNTTDPSYTVTVNSDSSGNPGTVLATLTNPTTTLSDGLKTFVADEWLNLAANTTYWVVVDATSGGDRSVAIALTDSDDETMKAPGWSISNTSKVRPMGTGSGGWQSADNSRMIEIVGVSISGTSSKNLGSIQFGAKEGTQRQDALTGGNGPWYITGLGGDDLLAGGSGDDHMAGADGDDTLYGGSGDDYLNGGPGNDTLRGEDGDDRLYGGLYDEGDDILRGGSGNDFLDGGAGADTLDGGTHRTNDYTDLDNNWYRSASEWELPGDTVSYYWSPRAVTVNLAATGNAPPTGGGHAEGDTLVEIENIIGSQHNDVLTGSNQGPNLLRGGRGADTLNGGFQEFRDNAADYRDSFAGVTINLGRQSNLLGRGSGGTAQGDTLRYINTIHGSNHDDVLNGGEAAETLYGHEGNDTLYGGRYGMDTLDGGPGNDTIDYSAYPVEAFLVFDLSTNAIGNPTVVSRLLEVTLRSIENITGSRFTDTLIGNEWSNTLNGYHGNDTVDYSASDAGVTVNLAAGTGSGGHARGDTLKNIENVTGSTHDDAITGNNSANVLVGGAGADTLTGGSGNDALIGSYGDDTLTGGAGRDEFYLDTAFGTDTITDYALGASKATSEKLYICIESEGHEPSHDGGVDAANGNDLVITVTLNSVAQGTVTLTGINRSHARFANLNVIIPTGSDDTCPHSDLLSQVNVVTGTGGADMRTGTAGPDHMYGLGGDDTLDGGAGDDTLDGGAGDDTLNGGAGDDTLAGGTGNDALNGLAGDDSLAGGAGADALDGGADSDTADYSASDAAVNVVLHGGTGIGGHAQGDTLANIENLVGSPHDDILIGDAKVNVIRGLAGNDLLQGLAAADVLDGGDGSDYASYAGSGAGVTVDLNSATAQSGGNAQGDTLTDIENLIGSPHADTLTGDANANTLRGGAGDDTLQGGGHGVPSQQAKLVSNTGQGTRMEIDLSADIGASFTTGGNPFGYILTSVQVDMVVGAGSDPTYTAAIYSELASGFPDQSLVTLTNPASLATGLNTFNVPGNGLHLEAGTEYYVVLAVSADGTSNPKVRTANTNHQDSALSGWKTSNNVVAQRNRGTSIWSYTSVGPGKIAVHGLTPRDGDDTLEGGPGADVLEGDLGTDTADYSNSDAAVTVDLSKTTAQSGGHAQGDTLTSIENLIGSPHDDTLAGNANANTLNGVGGTDTASYAGSVAGVTVDLNSATAQSGGDAQGDTLTDIENLTGSAHADNLTGDANANTLRGGAGDDTLKGGPGLSMQPVKLAGNTAQANRGQFDLSSDVGLTFLTGNNPSGYILTSVQVDMVVGTGNDPTYTAAVYSETASSNTPDQLLVTLTNPTSLATGLNTFNVPGEGLNLETGKSYWVVLAVSADGASNPKVRTANTSDEDSALPGWNIANAGVYQFDTIVADEWYFEFAEGPAKIAVHGHVIPDDGADTLEGGAGADALDGLAGDDSLAGGAGADALDGGLGTDTADYSNSDAAVTVDLHAGTGTGGDAQGDTLTGIENLTGSAHDDSLTGDANANTLLGGAGDDTLNGGDGSDTLNGGDGNDTLSGNAGADALEGGAGTDTAAYSNSDATVTVDLSKSTAQSGGHAQGDTLTGIENITGSAHDDTLTGDANANTLDGGDGDDTLSGNAGDDTLSGNAGDDILSGGGGSDTLSGNAGSDEFRFHASFGTDTISDYTLGASTAASEKIYLCMGTAANAPTHSGADSGSDRVITVTFNSATAGTITLKGINSSSTNFSNLNIQILPANSDGSCLTPPTPGPDASLFQAWFINETPNINIGRVFMMISTNRFNATGVCFIADGVGNNRVNCPSGTLVNPDNPSKGEGVKIPVWTTATLGGETVTSLPIEVVFGGPKLVPSVWASGGNGKLLVGWDASTNAVTGEINAYVVEIRKGTSGTWSSQVKAASDREHTFTGLVNGTWQVRVRARNNAGDTDASTHILGTTSEVRTVTLATGNTNTPGVPTSTSVTAGSGKLTVEWQLPAAEAGSLAHGYTVRHKVSGAADNTYVETTVHPRRVNVDCPGSCKNPRKLEISGLTAGTEYVVGIKSLNVNGASAWVTIGSTHTPT